MDEGFDGGLVGIWHDRPSEAHGFGFAISKLRFGFASLAWSCTQYAISDGGGAATVGCDDGFAGAGAYLYGRVGSLEYFL